MSFLSDWFIQLDPTLRFYWGIAIFASIVVIIQMTMSFAGMAILIRVMLMLISVPTPIVWTMQEACTCSPFVISFISC